MNITRIGPDEHCSGARTIWPVRTSGKENEGISVEVIDVRSLVPLDVETLTRSVNKTSRAVVLHEAARRLGYGAEIAATIQDECFWSLDHPVVRIAAKNTPVPTSPPLEDAVVPQTGEVIETLRKVATT